MTAAKKEARRVPPMTRYALDEVRAALREHWGLSLRRGGDMTDLGRDGRFDTVYSKTGYVIGGQLPGRGHGYQRFRSLGAVVRVCDLGKGIVEARRRALKST